MTELRKRSILPKPERYAEAGSETAHQISLFMWSSLPDIQTKYPELKWMFHIPNGGTRHKAEAGKLRASGVKRGVPDICLPVPRGKWLGLWIELKRPKQKDGRKAGIATDDQKPWITYLKSAGYGAIVCVGWEEARDTIISYLEWKG